MGPQWDAEDVGQQTEDKLVSHAMRGAEQGLKRRLKANVQKSFTKNWTG